MQIDLWPGGPTLRLADHWQTFGSLPDDPPGTHAFGYKFTGGESGVVVVKLIAPDDAMELDAQSVIDGIRRVPDVIEGQVGLIDVDVARTASGVPYVYSIVKIRVEPAGVEYNLTLHFPGERPVQLQGGFAEGNLTGMRDAMVYELAQRNNMVGEPTADDPSGGWAHDPFDHSTTGFVMNMSELPRFDEQFPGHPLSMARELLRAIAGA